MGSQGRVFPMAEEFTSVSAIVGAELTQSTHGDDDEPAFAHANPQEMAAPPSDETVVEAFHSRIGDASERGASERGVVAPVRHGSLTAPAASPAESPQPTPLLVKSAQHGSSRSPGTLKKTRTFQVLSKTDLKAKQKARIERNAQPPKNHSLSDRLAYRIDLYISTRKGQTITLAVLGLGLMLIGACILKASQPSQQFHEMVWASWTFLGDSGSHTALTQSGLRVIGVLMTLTGILYFSVIMGFVVDGIRDKMDSLKKGKSKVAEDTHTLMLGWTDKSISLIKQICLASASEKGGTIIVLAEADKEELEAELASQMRPEELRGTKVIFRTGLPMLSVDLNKVAAHRARSILVLAQTSGDADRSDAAVLRTVLSLKTLPELNGHIVAELRDIDNEPLVRLVGGDEVEVLVSHDVIGRLVLMAARSPGLARVFTCLLGFDGNEFYFKEWPECVGVRFGDLSERFPNAIPFGIKRQTGEVLIAPASSISLNAGDQIMVLAEDDDTYKACPPECIDVGELPSAAAKSTLKEKILMCGWRRDIRDMIQLLDSLVPPQTELHMLCEEPCHLRNKLLLESGLDVAALKNLRLVHHYGNTAVRRHLERLPLHTYTSLLVLADGSREDDIMHSDSHTLASLLLVRDLQTTMSKKAGRVVNAVESCRCICEVLDPRTQRTISTSETILKLSEFIQSNEIISCILAMVSESRDVRVILDELLGADGASFEMEPSTRYCTATEHVSFWQIAKRAMKREEVLCGYQKRGAIDATVLNPDDKAARRGWSGVDFIVLRHKKDTPPIVHQPSSQSLVQVDDFERTTKSRMGKATMVRQHILEALVQEQEIANIEHLNGQERELLTRAVRSYIGSTTSIGGGALSAASAISRRASALSLELDSGRPIDAMAVRTLVAITKSMADVLEQHVGGDRKGRYVGRTGSIDSTDENAEEYVMA